MKKILLMGATFLFGLGLVGCSMVLPPQETKDTDAVTGDKVVESLNPPEKTHESQAPDLKEEAAKNSILKVLQQGYADLGTVVYDAEQNAFIITPTDEAFIQDVEYVLSTGQTEEWDQMVDAFVELSAEISASAGEGTSLAIANPVKTDNVILVISDGVLVYDAVKEELSK